MRLSTQYGFSFLCNLKCTFTSIESAIGQYCSISYTKHPSLEYINYRNFNRYMQKYHKHIIAGACIEPFSLIRENASWIVSWHKLRKREEL